MDRCKYCGVDDGGPVHECTQAEIAAYGRGRCQERADLLDMIACSEHLSGVVKSYIVALAMRGQHVGRASEQVLALAVEKEMAAPHRNLREVLEDAEQLLNLRPATTLGAPTEASHVYQAALSVLVHERDWLGDLCVREDEAGYFVIECSVCGGPGQLSSAIGQAARKWTKRGINVKVKCGNGELSTKRGGLRLVKS